jgi:hypothetical protein
VTLVPRCSVPWNGHRLLIALALLGSAIWTPAAEAQVRPFNGAYIAIDVGAQHIIGGSLVGGVDTLQDASRLVAAASGGVRRDIRGIVIGGELGLGVTDGDIELRDPGRGLVVTYRNNRQWDWALMAGPALGRKTLLFGYLSEVTRQFDVTIERGDAVTSQRDEQGLLRFGLGVEHRVGGPLHVRVAVGTSRANFGDRATNKAINKRLEATAGLLWQF